MKCVPGHSTMSIMISWYAVYILVLYVVTLLHRVSVSRQLPPVNTLAKDIDVDGLESSLSLLSSKYTKKTTAASKLETSPHAAVASPGLVFELRLCHVISVFSAWKVLVVKKCQSSTNSLKTVGELCLTCEVHGRSS